MTTALDRIASRPRPAPPPSVETLYSTARDAGWPDLYFATSPNSNWEIIGGEAGWDVFLHRAWERVRGSALRSLEARKLRLLK